MRGREQTGARSEAKCLLDSKGESAGRERKLRKLAFASMPCPFNQLILCAINNSTLQVQVQLFQSKSLTL